MNKNTILNRFIHEKSGQFAVLFAILLLPLLAGIGLAIDHVSAVQAETRLRDSTDAAAFFAATEYRRTGELPEKTKVLDFVSTNYALSRGELEPRLLHLSVVGRDLFLETSVIKPLAIMRVFGHQDTDIGARSVVNVGLDQDLEIALVLDTTASMQALSGSSSNDLDPKGKYFSSNIPNVTRIEALKFSAKRFTDTVFAIGGNDGSVRVSIVPFAEYVNVGTHNRGASWLSVPVDSQASGQTCEMETPVIGTQNCVAGFNLVDGAQVPYTTCENVFGPPVNVCSPIGVSIWEGCVGSRKHPLNLTDGFPTVKFTGIMDVYCAAPIAPLSDKKSDVLSAIANMGTTGNTYIPEGVMWGQRVLSSQLPFTEAKPISGSRKVKKIMVVMTDGDNQAVANIPASPTHRGINPSEADYAVNRAQTDAWTLDACNEAKGADIEVFTISFGSDITAKARTIVKSCATDTKHYFDAKDASALNDAFITIAAEIGGLRLSG